MADLDYAYLADYAVVQEGKLTAVGASYTRVRVGSFPGAHSLSVAGRIRATEGTQSVPLVIQVLGAERSFDLNLEVALANPSDPDVYDGKVGILFAIALMIPLPVAGLYEVHVHVDGAHARRLAFEASAG